MFLYQAWFAFWGFFFSLSAVLSILISRKLQCWILGGAKSCVFKGNISLNLFGFIPKAACAGVRGSTHLCRASLLPPALLSAPPPAFLSSPGCRRQWDNITCWPEAEVGEVVVRPCPKYFRFLTSYLGKQTPKQTHGFSPVGFLIIPHGEHLNEEGETSS